MKRMKPTCSLSHFSTFSSCLPLVARFKIPHVTARTRALAAQGAKIAVAYHQAAQYHLTPRRYQVRPRPVWAKATCPHRTGRSLR